MNYIGHIDVIRKIGSQLIVAISLSDMQALRVSAGQRLMLEGRGEATIKGWKLWPDKASLDVLVDELPAGAQTNDRVLLGSGP